MSSVAKIFKYIFNSDYRFLQNANRGGYKKWSDERLVRRRYRAVLHRELNLENPQRFSEKMQWLKLHDHQERYSVIVDKVAAKKHIADLVGEEYVVPTLGVWDSFDEINFDELPEQFVLKCTHDSASYVICRDKSRFDKKKAKKRLEQALKINFYYRNREWPYRNVPPRIIAEVYLSDTNQNEAGCSLVDYKFFCFDGVPKAMFISKECGDTHVTDWFDMEYNHLPIKMANPHADVPPAKPEKFEDMVRLATILSQNYPQIRVDFYQVNGKLYVGELTLYHSGGFFEIHPEEWDIKMGGWISIDGIKTCNLDQTHFDSK
ncbi:MAG: glycosyl transferase [Ruminococcaceae bacterium]|nr:glycosyl transferase [Oscillospiraceae bacterium]